MAAGDLVDLGNLRGHWDMVGESVQLDRLSANAGSLIICADRRPFRWERRRWPSSFDIDLDDFARLWRGDASQRGKTPTLQGAGERGTERWAARRLSVRPMQKPGRRRGSCNSMSRSNIRPVCDLRSAADSGSGCLGMSTPLSQGSSSASVPQRQKLVAGSRAAGLLCAEHHEPVSILDAGYRHLARLIIGAGRSGHLPRRADAYFEDPIRWPSTCATCPQDGRHLTRRAHPTCFQRTRRNQSPASLTPLLARRPVRPSFGACAGRLDEPSRIQASGRSTGAISADECSLQLALKRPQGSGPRMCDRHLVTRTQHCPRQRRSRDPIWLPQPRRVRSGCPAYPTLGPRRRWHGQLHRV
jgi:hypothetical protein